ncbi:glycosyltransferase family A protein [Olivibacter sp. XZL3]|uniref:glycosyltransferase family 2 protein n=1 Tax=Olivibacter sp. XZL3 TaxID=1735116 RepID=UPI0010660547|nr:glycosyltransferase family A protein [Olivibacter sp. XZL3]
MISVIIPCYNCERFLARAVESVVKQGHADWEMILVNNNSADGTQRLIDQYVMQYPTKVSALSEGKKGACHARNAGLKIARGEWIQFLDADDELLPKKWERQLQLAGADIDVVIGAFTRVYVELNKEENFFTPYGTNIWQAILRSNAGITSANLYRRDALTAVNGWDVNLSSSQEYDLLFRILKSGASVIYDTALGARIYEESGSVSRPRSKEGMERIVNNYVDLRIRIASYLKQENIWNSELKDRYAVSLYEMMLNRKGASIDNVHAVMRQLGLKTSGAPQLFQRSKFYIKKFILRR